MYVHKLFTIFLSIYCSRNFDIYSLHCRVFDLFYIHDKNIFLMQELNSGVLSGNDTKTSSPF